MGNLSPRHATGDLRGALHLQRQHAELDVSLDPPRRPMEHRSNLKPGLLHPAKARFDDPAPFVAKRHILGGERLVVGDHHELTVEFCRGRNLGLVELWGAARLTEASGCGKFHRDWRFGNDL